MRRREGRSSVGVFTGWSRNGLARWSTREGKNQWGVAGGESCATSPHKGRGGKEIVGRQKLAVVRMMLSSCGSGQGGMSRVFGRGRCRRGGLWKKASSRESERERALFGRGGNKLCACRNSLSSGQLNRLERGL